MVLVQVYNERDRCVSSFYHALHTVQQPTAVRHLLPLLVGPHFQPNESIPRYIFTLKMALFQTHSCHLCNVRKLHFNRRGVNIDRPCTELLPSTLSIHTHTNMIVPCKLRPSKYSLARFHRKIIPQFMTKCTSFDFKAGQIKSPLQFQYLLLACFLKNGVITHKASLGSRRLPQYKT